jgi:hypothetical protein
MKITFGQQEGGTMQLPAYKYEAMAMGSMQKQASAYQVDFGQNPSFFMPKDENGQHESKTLLTQGELGNQMENQDVGLRQDYMTLMSHTLSEEDYARLSEEGFPIEEMNPEETVTIVDKIKVLVALSGQQIAGYTDDIDRETLTKALGSETYGNTLAETLLGSFQKADIPVTEDNAKQVLQAADMAMGLEQPTDQEYRYMVKEGMEPEIGSFYLAENSGITAAKVTGAAKVAGTTNATGAAKVAGTAKVTDTLRETSATQPSTYYVKGASGYVIQQGVGHWEGMEDQIRNILFDYGYDSSDPSFPQHLDQAVWLTMQDLPMTGENVDRLDRLTSVTFPITREQAIHAAAAAIGEGKPALRGKLDPESLKAAAQTIYGRVADLPKLLSARRQLEEARLFMSAEVNVKLLRSGFAIDTAPMEELIQALKQAEQEVANNYFPEDTQSVEKYRLYTGAREEIAALPTYPAKLIGMLDSFEVGSLEVFCLEGKNQKTVFEKAGQMYEALGTSPRRDLGDNIQKAFANVDAILQEINIPLTEENRRAVRILGYNRMELTQGNLEAVKETDALVNRIINNLTPHATLQMIRKGINPLEYSLEELDAYFQEQTPSFSEKAEDYSRFLYRLEQRHDITAQERSSYIGVYRLLHQLKQSDGAPVGSLLNLRAQPSFQNLLTALRTKSGSVNERLDPSFGFMKEVISQGDQNIAHQIQVAFEEADGQQSLPHDTIEGQESVRQYNRRRMSELRNAVSDVESIALLQRGEIPMHAANLIAAKALLHAEGKWVERLMGVKQTLPDNTKTEDGEEHTDIPGNQSDTEGGEGLPVWETIGDKDAFSANYADMLNRAAAETVDRALGDRVSALDVRELHLFHKQLQLLGALQRREEYYLPMEISGRPGTMRVTFRQGEFREGTVDLRLRFQGDGESIQIAGHFAADTGQVDGYVTVNNREALETMQKAADIMTETLTDNGQTASIRVLYDPDSAASGIVSPRAGRQSRESSRSETQDTVSLDNRQLYSLARDFLKTIDHLYP